MKKTLTLIVAASAMFFASTARAEDHSGHDHAKKEAKEAEGHEGHNHKEGEHDKAAKKTLAIKGIGIIEVGQDVKKGSVTLTLLDAERKPLKPAKAPRLNLMVDGKRKQVKTKAIETVKAGNAFTATNALLKGTLTGQVFVKIGEKNHKVDLNPHANCGHDHGHTH